MLYEIYLFPQLVFRDIKFPRQYLETSIVESIYLDKLLVFFFSTSFFWETAQFLRL